MGPEQSDLKVDAGIFLFARVGDYVWVDTNGNGVQDGNEAGVADVFVVLRSAATQAIVQISQTDAAGKYFFTKLAPGSYLVQFEANATLYTFTAPYKTEVDSDSDVIDFVNGLTDSFVLAAGATNLDIDAGLLPWSCLGGNVWIDIDGDGTREGSEAQVQDITVVLFNEYKNVTLAVSTTDAAGHYQFCNLVVGSYSVEFVIDAQVYMYTTPSVNGDPNLNSMVTSFDGAGVGNTPNVPITLPGQVID